MILCENCGKPATMFKATPHGEAPTCDSCKPASWQGEARPLVKALPDLSGRKTLSKQEAADSLGISMDSFERHVVPELRTIRKGARVLVPVRELERWVDDNAARALRDP